MNRKLTQRTGSKGRGPRKTRSASSGSAKPRRNSQSRTPAAQPSAAKAQTPSRPKPAPLVPPVLSGRQMRDLRARAHALEPIVQVGHAGLSEAVVRAVNGALHDHELIKVRLHEPEDKRAMAEELAGAARAALCGLIGHTLILYRPRPKPKAVSGVARSSIKRNQPKPRARAARAD